METEHLVRTSGHSKKKILFARVLRGDGIYWCGRNAAFDRGQEGSTHLDWVHDEGGKNRKGEPADG